MATDLMRASAVTLQFDLAIVLRKIDSVDVALLGEMDKEERAWYINRSNELKFYRDRLVASLGERGEETDVRKEKGLV